MIAFTVSMTVALGGCSTGASDRPALPEVPSAFQQSGGASALPEMWWESLNDPQLSALIREGIEHNLSIKQAWARVKQADAIVKRDASEKHPSLTGSARASVSQSGLRGFDYGLTLGIAASYEVDLWSRIAHEAEAAALDAVATRSDLQGSAVTISGEIATTWYQLVATRGQLELVEQQLETNRSWLALVELRYGQGKAGAADVLRQRQQLKSKASDVIALKLSEALLSMRLAAWLGRSPNNASFDLVKTLIAAPPLPSTGVPSELLGRRPDVRSAQLRLEAADERLAAAIANQYPQLTLSANLSDDVFKLFDAWVLGLAANLVAPILDGGRRAAEVERNEAVVELAVYAYGQAVLDALYEVEEALLSVARQTEQVEGLREQLELAQRAESLARMAYANGGATYLEVLDALRTLNGLQRDLLNAERDLLLYHVGLHRALGGGWAMSDNDSALNVPATSPQSPPPAPEPEHE